MTTLLGSPGYDTSFSKEAERLGVCEDGEPAAPSEAERDTLF